MATGRPFFEVYQDKKEKYRWRLIAANGKKVASSGQRFESKANACRAVEDARRDTASAEAATRGC